MDVFASIWPWRRARPDRPAVPAGRDPTVPDVVIQRGQRTTPSDESGDAREAYIVELQEDLRRLCQQPSPLLQRLHLYLAIVEAQCQIRIHRGTLPLTNEEFDLLLRAIRTLDDAETAEAALALRKSLVETGDITVPPRLVKSRRRPS